MFRHSRILSMLGVVMLALVFSLGSAGHASAQSQGCDITGTRNGTATPTYGTTGTTIIFRAQGFRPGEDVSFWFTTPQQEVFGTANPVSGGVAPDGSVALRLTIPKEFVDFAPGKWAITFQGATSNNVAVIYFCVLTSEQATAVAQPPTATSVPPTATSVPATATSVATTAPTTVATTAPALSPTAAATNTVVAAASPTTAAALPTDTAGASLPVATSTTAAIPTEVLPVATTDTGAGAGAGTGGLPGMPTTGQSDNSLLVTLILVALGLVGVGALASRTKGITR